MDRRTFLKSSTMATAALMLGWDEAFALGTKATEVGKAWKGWKKGHFQV
ncbi:MAG: twin-arginine translocation signal domain-containing protein, partial [Bacteroidales bacterium]|nr:twin-arginine translocation signal domain-containing protein [Bacteroidales bacterium]